MKWVIILAILGQSASVTDMHATIAARDWVRAHPGWGFVETDPLERPFVHLPAPAVYATNSASSFGATLLGYKMRRSRHALLRKTWWVPQVAQIAANAYGAGFTLAHHPKNK